MRVIVFASASDDDITPPTARSRPS